MSGTSGNGHSWQMASFGASITGSRHRRESGYQSQRGARMQHIKTWVCALPWGGGGGKDQAHLLVREKIERVRWEVPSYA